MLAFSIDYYGVLFRATQSVGLFCTYADLKLHAPYFEEDDIVKKNNFFVKTENGYELYMNGTYIGTLDEIPNELKNINIRRK